jgi:hypothetical protein
MSVTERVPKRRWLWLIPGGLLIAGFVVFFVWWQYFKTTPAYSLALLVDVAQRNDQAAFDRVVDLDQVIDNFIAQAAEGSAMGLTPELVTPVRMQLQSLAPETSAGIKQVVKEEIRTRINELTGSSGARPFLVTAVAMPFVADIKQTGDTAQVRLNENDEVELRMERREGSDWKVISLRDQALAGRVVQGIIKRLPGTESQIDKQLGTLPETLQKLPLLNAK